MLLLVARFLSLDLPPFTAEKHYPLSLAQTVAKTGPGPRITLVSTARCDKKSERLLDGDVAEAFFQAVLQQARERNLLSDEHFTVDGTLLEAWASVKSYQRKDAMIDSRPQAAGDAEDGVWATA